MYAKVLVDIKHEDVNRFFDYAIPSSLIDELSIGMRVIVPFGNQERMGYVISLINHSDQATKEIIEILDVIPTIQHETFHLIDYLVSQTNELYSVVFETVVPSEMGLEYYQEVQLLKPELVDADFLSLFSSKGVLRIAKGQHQYDYQLRKYHRKEAISFRPIWKSKAKTKEIFTYTFNPNHQYQRINQYPELYAMEDKQYLKQDLLEFGLTEGKINTLCSHNVFIRQKSQIDRQIKHVYQHINKDITLTDEQQKVYQLFYDHQKKYQTFLLKGITGSGKTELYLKWIKDSISKQHQVMILVPEIALIAPMAQRLESEFGDIAIYHSHLSKGERFDQYMKIKQGKINILLGTRSAVFMPFEKLGLIIIDEEHDDAYQQVERCSYDARDIALLRAKYHHCPLILGSATPSLISMYKTKTDVYDLLTLDERPFGIAEPSIELVDMRQELKAKNVTMFSRQLKLAIEKRLENQEQTMILFNRKGYAPFVMCRQCGYVPTCPNCGIALTYYQTDNQLKCHYCGYEENYQNTCHECHQPAMKSVGVGIEHVEQEIKKVFPKARVLRMDANMTKTKGAHEIIWHDFQSQKADILLGTQMIAKGLDFPNVTLVGVLMADLMLRTPSYRSSEDTFMLLTQVAGRSGRLHPGEVIIQGYDLNHFAIKDVTKGYDAFYEEAIYERQVMGYEPFMHVHQILAEGQSYLKTYQRLFEVKKKLSINSEIKLLGPVPAYIKKKNDAYRFVLTIKTSLSNKTPIFEAITAFKNRDVNLRFYPIINVL